MSLEKYGKRLGLSLSKLTFLLVNEVLNFQTLPFFCQKNVRSFCTCIAKAPHILFQQKNITTVNLVSTLRLTESSANGFVMVTML